MNRDVIQKKALQILLILLISSTFIFNLTAISSWSIIVIVAIMLIIYLFSTGFQFRVKVVGFHKKTLLFALYCALSALWALDSNLALEDALTILKILLCMSAVFLIYQNNSSIEDFLIAVMWSGPLIGAYAILYTGVRYFTSLVLSSSRIASSFANTNSLGMWMSLSIVVFLYFFLHYGWKWKYLFSIIPIILLVVSQSRTGLISCIAGMVFVVISTYRTAKRSFFSLIRILAITIVLFWLLSFLSKLPFFSGMMERLGWLENLATGSGHVDHSIRLRQEMISIGWNTFLRHPIFGVGLSNSNILTRDYLSRTTYLHNNFIELLADGGIIGFIIYYSIYFELLRKLVPMVKKNILYADICVVILLTQLVMDVGTVSYYSKDTYFVFLLAYLFIYQSRNCSILEK